MPKGKKKGHKKNLIEIRDECISPYYLVKDERQYIKMLEGNTLPQGYFRKLSHALSSISQDIHLLQDSGKTLSLRQFINKSEEVNNQILQKLDA